jgi:regulator of replication initiation timing
MWQTHAKKIEGTCLLCDMLEDFDPNAIEDESLRQVVLYLMNVVETLSAKVAELTEENQRLREENNRLKGEQGKPRILPNKERGDLSSEKERRQSRPPQKSSKQAKIGIDREVGVKVDQERLPAEAQFKGYEEVVVQDLDFRTDNVKFRREKYYSPNQKRTYLAPLPAGYTGQFGPGVKAWVLALYFGGRMSEPKILEVLHTVGLSISSGELSNLLIKDQEAFHAEHAKILEAGLQSSPWQHLDRTGTRVNGHNQHGHVLCNPLSSAYCTTPCKDRMSLLRVLQGGADPVLRGNDLASSEKVPSPFPQKAQPA